LFVYCITIETPMLRFDNPSFLTGKHTNKVCLPVYGDNKENKNIMKG